MGSRTVIRFRQSPQGSVDPSRISLAAIERAISQGTSGTFGNVVAHAAMVRLRRPFAYNLMAVVIDTDRAIDRSNRRVLAEQAVAAINGAGFGTWLIPSLTSPIYYTEPLQRGTNNLAANQAVIAGNIPATPTVSTPPPRWSAPPTFGLDMLVQGADVTSKEPARSGISAKQADTLAPPESPHNDWTLDATVPVLIAVGAVALLAMGGVAIYRAVT